MTLGAALLAIRILLAATLALAALTKLRDAAGSRRALEDFDIPRALTAPIRVFLPGAELAIGGALLFHTSALAAGIAASLLFALFTGVLLRSLVRGRKPACHCFGRLDSRPIGWHTIARTGILLAGALVVVVAGWQDAGPGLFDWLNGLTPSQRIEAVAVAGALVLLGVQKLEITRLRRQLAELRASPGAAPTEPPEFRWPSPRIGTPAPQFALPGSDGVTITLDALRARGKPVAVVFTGADCGGCHELLPDVSRWQRDESALTVALISRGDADVTRALALEHGLTRVLIEKTHEVSTYYGAIGTPSALIVRSDGTVGSELAAGVKDVRHLIALFLPDAAAVAVAPPVDDATQQPTSFWDAAPEPTPPQAVLPVNAQPTKDVCVQDELLADGSMVLYNRCHQRVLTLNPTAALVWESCDGQRDVQAIADEVRDVFGTASDVEHHVHHVLEELLQAGMISLPAVDALVSDAVPAANA